MSLFHLIPDLAVDATAFLGHLSLQAIEQIARLESAGPDAAQ